MKKIGYDIESVTKEANKKRDFVTKIVLNELNDKKDSLYPEEKDLILSQIVLTLIQQYNPEKYVDLIEGYETTAEFSNETKLNQFNRYRDWADNRYIKEQVYILSSIINDYFVNAKLDYDRFHAKTVETFANLLNEISPYYRTKTIEAIKNSTKQNNYNRISIK